MKTKISGIVKNLAACAAGALVAGGVFCPIRLMADSQKVDGVKWSYYTSRIGGRTVAIVTGASPASGTLRIPEKLGGYTVYEIEEEAFDNCVDITGVVFPEGLEVIGYDALCGCENLGDIVIPTTVREGISFPFAYKMNSITVAEGNPYFKSVDGVVYSKDGFRLVFFPSGRTGEWTVPDSVTALDDASFAGASLSTVNIHARVGELGQGVFIDCFNMTRFSVDEANNGYKDEDGVLLSKDGTRLVAYPAARGVDSVYTVPSTVTTLDEAVFSGSSLAGIILPGTLKRLPYEAFVDSDRLKSVIVGSGIEAVGHDAFYCASKLTSLTLPATVQSVEYLSFEDCSSLKTIYVPSSARVDDEAFSDCPARVVYYSSAPLVKFNLNFAGAPDYPYDRNVVSGQPVGVLMAPTREGYTFSGWFTTPDGGSQVSKSTSVTGDVTYYAHWTPLSPTPEFTGELYGFWYDDDVECGLYMYDFRRKFSPYWRSDFVEVNGVKEPATFGYDGYAFPVRVEAGQTFEAEILHGNSTDAHVKSVRVLTDAQMYAKFRMSRQWMNDDDDWDKYCMSALWSGGTLPTRAWIVVEQNNVTAGAKHLVNLGVWPIVNHPDSGRFFNESDGVGGLSSTWTISSFAAELGASLTGVRYVTESVHYTVGIKDGARFPQRVWNVCSPFDIYDDDDCDSIDIIDDLASEELVFAPGLFFIAPGTEPTAEYRIAFAPGSDEVAPSMPEQVVGAGKVAKLNPCAFAAPAGKKFAGWRRNDNGRRYDDGVMVFNLAEPGETVKLTAIWE